MTKPFAGARTLTATMILACGAGCAAPAPDIGPAALFLAPPPALGTVVARRDAPPSVDTADALSAALHLSDVATAPGARVEIIVRQDDGNTVSVVDHEAYAPSPGARVVVIRGDRTRLARA